MSGSRASRWPPLRRTTPRSVLAALDALRGAAFGDKDNGGRRSDSAAAAGALRAAVAALRRFARSLAADGDDATAAAAEGGLN